MKKGDLITAKVTGTVFPCVGLCQKVEEEQDKNSSTDEKDAELIRVKNALSGETIRCRISRKKHGRCEGTLLEVIKRPENELSDADCCPHDGVCGGCVYQRLTYEDQLALKEKQIRTLFSPVLYEEEKTPGVWQGLAPSPDVTGYRNKMELTFGDFSKGGPLALGMHRRGAWYDIVTCPDCRIMHPDMGRILERTLSYFSEKKIPYYHRMNHIGYLRHLLLRRARGTGEIIVCLVTSSQLQTLPCEELVYESAAGVLSDAASVEQQLLDGWKEALLSEEPALSGSIAGILHTVNDRLADTVFDQGTKTLYGRNYFTEQLSGLSFQITPFSFFQTNSAGAEVLYGIARRMILESLSGKKAGVLYDLYSGTGTIAQMLSDAADSVIGVEIVEEAVHAAEENARQNHLDNCRFLAGDVLKVLDQIEELPDFIVLDPPRDGVHPKALSKILSYGIPAMLYISCKPTSLARDLAPLHEAGYRVRSMACVDLFPFTSSIETIALLSRR